MIVLLAFLLSLPPLCCLNMDTDCLVCRTTLSVQPAAHDQAGRDDFTTGLTPTNSTPTTRSRRLNFTSGALHW